MDTVRKELMASLDQVEKINGKSPSDGNSKKVPLGDVLSSKADFASCVRGPLPCDDIKEWPKQEKIDICWRMPQDS